MPQPVRIVGKNGKDVSFSVATGSGAIAATITPGDEFRLLSMMLHLAVPDSTTENLVVALDAGDGTTYDIPFYTYDINSESATDVVKIFGAGYEFEADDVITVALTNTGAAAYGLRVVYEFI